MANFIGLVYATLKQEGIDTSGMSSEEAVAKYNELQKKSGGKSGEKEPTPAENRKLSKEEADEFVDNIYSYLKTKPNEKELYAKMESAGINKSGIKYYDTLAPMKSMGERANLIEKIYKTRDFRKKLK